MRVSVVIVNLEGGGKEKAAILLANGFAAQGIETDLVVLSQEGIYWDSDIVSPHVNLRYFFKDGPKTTRFARYLRMAQCIWPFRAYMRERCPDVCITFWGLCDWLGALERHIFRPSMKLILTIHDMPSIYAKVRGFGVRRRLFNIIKCSLMDKVVMVSKITTNDAAQYYHIAKHKIATIYNPIITPEILELMEAELQHPWLQPSSCPVILSIGSLTLLKNHAFLIQVFAMVRKKYECKLIILGEGRERKKLEALIDNLGLKEEVSMPGFVHNPYAYIKKAAVFAHTSFTEALPSVIIEALAGGCPVIAMDCPGGIAEILESGRYGVLVPINDDLSMTKAISDALEGKFPCTLEERIMRGREFNINQTVKQYLNLIELI